LPPVALRDSQPRFQPGRAAPGSEITGSWLPAAVAPPRTSTTLPQRTTRMSGPRSRWGS